ncbi:MAG: enoyl-CoA hydratase-related protein, partial [Rubrivivax sp.]
PGLLELVRACTGAPQVLVAALHGTAYGGGLLVALACDWRVAEAGTRLAMPEVELGLLPTFGGTQLLPRLIGVEAALRLVVDGEVWTAEQALEHGLVDEVVPPGARVAHALQACRVRAKRPVWSLARHEQEPAAARAQAFSLRRRRLAAPPEGPLAPLRCLEVMEGGLEAPLEEALAREHAVFLELLAGAESRRLRRRFFGERALRREAFDRRAVEARLRQARHDWQRLREEARGLLCRGEVASAEALDALMVQCLELPRHAPGPLEGWFGLVGHA